MSKFFAFERVHEISEKNHFNRVMVSSFLEAYYRTSAVTYMTSFICAVTETRTEEHVIRKQVTYARTI